MRSTFALAIVIATVSGQNTAVQAVTDLGVSTIDTAVADVLGAPYEDEASVSKSANSPHTETVSSEWEYGEYDAQADLRTVETDLESSESESSEDSEEETEESGADSDEDEANAVKE